MTLHNNDAAVNPGITLGSLAGFARRQILLILLLLVCASDAADKVAAPDFSKYLQSGVSLIKFKITPDE